MRCARLGGVTDELTRLLDRLLERTGEGAKLGLERVREALALLGDPQESLSVVHVAGTNGKGSTSAMVESIARAAGLRTGLYTSPHLCRFQERIRIGGEPIDDALFAAALGRALDPRAGSMSFFEVLTVAGLWAMREAGVELAVLEVGLGGRLDATNVVSRPRATAVTSIGRDHERFLGTSLSSIAGEKAGIAKRGVPLVIGALPPEALATVIGKAQEAGASPLWSLEPPRGAGADVARIELHRQDARAASLVLPGGAQTTLEPALEGPHQLHNAAIAAALAWHALPDRTRWSRATRRGVATACWPGRLERIGTGAVTVVLDCAHNEEAAAALVRALAGEPGPAAVLVFGALEDKPWRAMLEMLAPLARERVYCEPLEPIGGRRSVPPATLAAALAGACARTPEEALATALARARPGERVLVAGSVFLVGALRALLCAERRDVLVPM